MKGFIKVHQTNNQLTYINVSNILIFYRSIDCVKILLVDNMEIECTQTLEDLEKLLYNASVS